MSVFVTLKGRSWKLRPLEITKEKRFKLISLAYEQFVTIKHFRWWDWDEFQSFCLFISRDLSFRGLSFRDTPGRCSVLIIPEYPKRTHPKLSTSLYREQAYILKLFLYFQWLYGTWLYRTVRYMNVVYLNLQINYFTYDRVLGVKRMTTAPFLRGKSYCLG